MRCDADEAGYSAVVLAPLGETEDVTIADIAVATAASRSRQGRLSARRLAKYNRLLRIRTALGDGES